MEMKLIIEMKTKMNKKKENIRKERMRINKKKKIVKIIDENFRKRKAMISLD